MRKAFVFRLYPTKAQAAALTEQVDTHRHLYNRALAERKATWETEQRSVTYGEQSASLKTQRTENPYLAKTNFSACQRTPKTLRDRVHACPCGYTADRDVNAAQNVVLLGTGNRLGLSRQAPSPAVAGLA
jgi:transposase